LKKKSLLKIKIKSGFRRKEAVVFRMSIHNRNSQQNERREGEFGAFLRN
jgi:hypothetical protein